jgi:hypothetical protein
MPQDRPSSLLEVKNLLIASLSFLALNVSLAQSSSTTWQFKKEFLPVLVDAVPGILKTEDAATGRFGSGIWISSDQAVIFTLAAAWAFNGEGNPHYHDAKLLEAIMRCGDALADTQDKTGRWMFRKKDNSTWGMYYNPWVYSRWIRAYNLIHDAMPPERREKWEKALMLGFSGIEKHELSGLHNIAAHQAMGLYFAGKTMNRPEWSQRGGAFLHGVAKAQDTNGFWSENVGPVVNYNVVYIDAIGTYYGSSRDPKVLPALERSARFHANFTYPDGSNIETIDERNPYSKRFRLANVGFTFTPEGRAYLKQQWSLLTKAQKADSVDVIASHLLYGEEGPVAPMPGEQSDSIFIMGDGKASVLRQRPWCAAFSAYTCPVTKSRWIEDRQNLVSLFHEKTGLILGGGNTKLQPLWSTFTVGDVSLLKHRAGDENPNFTQPSGLQHVPTAAHLATNGNRLELKYGDVNCSVSMNLSSNTAHLSYTAAVVTNRVEAHVTFLPAIGNKWRTASGKSGELNATIFTLTAADAGAWFEHNGWRVTLPQNSTLTWPTLPHNPYRKDGRAEVSEGRLVLTLPFSKEISKQEIDVTVTSE